ncbi:MAG: DUF2911 domain-containing protein [Gemmatimonadaceae bacterium]
MKKLFSVLACALPLTLGAQIRASEIGTMSQIVDGTKITMEYSRPRARGRDTLFGKSDRTWGTTWTPGANYATTLQVSRDVKLDGHLIPKRKYSVWFVLKNATEWTMVLDTNSHLFHEERPDSSAQQVRFPVRVASAPFTEVLTWSMPELRISGGDLVFQWERARVAMSVEVEPSLVMTLPAADAAAYLGSYTYSEVDSKGKVTQVKKFIVTHEGGYLRGQWDPNDSYFQKVALVRIAPDWFAPAVYDKNGVIYEVLRPDMTFEFTRKNGKAESILVRYDNDEIGAKARRIP